MSKALGLALALFGCALLLSERSFSLQVHFAPARQPTVPFEETQGAMQLPEAPPIAPSALGASSSQATKPAGEAGSAIIPATGPVSWSISAPMSSPMASSRPAGLGPAPVLSRSYLLLNGLHLGMALLDVEMTQHCIANHHCQEGNPIMPSSHAGQIGISLGAFAYAAGSSYWLKKHSSRFWWIAPSAGITAHTVGVISGVEHR